MREESVSTTEAALPGRTLNTDIVPLGERAWRSILDHVIAVGDEAEAPYLEIKSTLEMGSKLSTAKIAKFLLGAANRRPHEASRHFHGYAVLVVGAQKDAAHGVPRGTEAHELEDRLRPYLGPQFPAFEFGRLETSPGREVLFIIAQPPVEGQGIFPCHKDFQVEDRRDNLEDGAIYVRGTSNSRHARSGEVLALVERARGGGKARIELDLDVLGQVSRVNRVEELLERLRLFKEAQFSKEEEPADDGVAVSFRALAPKFGLSQLPTAEDRLNALSQWRSEAVEQIARGREYLLGAGLPGVGISVVSLDRFISKPHLTVTFHGCELIDHINVTTPRFEKLVPPIMPERRPFGEAIDIGSLRPSLREYPVLWRNRGEDAEVVVTRESFRPNVPWESDRDDYVLICRDLDASSVEVTWSLTEDQSDVVTTGRFHLPTSRIIDAGDLYSWVFHSDN